METKYYINGREFTSKKKAEEYQKKLDVQEIVDKSDFTEEEIDKYFEMWDSPKKLVFEDGDWRKPIDLFLLEQLLDKILPDIRDGKIVYRLVKQYWDGEEGVLLTAKSQSLPEGEYPQEFLDYKEKSDDIENGNWVEFELKEDKGAVKVFKVVKKSLSPLEKLEKDIALTEDEISNFLRENESIYTEQDPDLDRWSRGVTSVVKAENGKTYCIHWLEGLTEIQENTFFKQPFECELKEKKVTVVRTIIKPVK